MSKSTDFGRSLAAIIASYFFTSFIGFLLNRIAFNFLVAAPPEGQIPTLTSSYMIVNLMISSLAALAGGFLAGLIAGRAPLLHALLLAGVLLLFSLITIFSFGKFLPTWYAISISTLTFLMAILGGWVRSLNHPRAG